MKLGLFLMLGISLGAHAGDSWKEEVLLHDGRKVIVERYVQRGGRHEIGQPGTFIDQSLSFAMPGNNRRVEWRDAASQDLGSSNFLPMLLDIASGTPYLVAYPLGCLAYNKWGRPNPPYVVFKYDNGSWQRVTVDELPLAIKMPNLLFSDPDITVAKIGAREVTASKIQEIVAETSQPEFKSILREPINYDPDCIPMVSNGKGLWRALAWFSRRPTLEACQEGCRRERYDDSTCPCPKLFEGKQP